MDGKPFQNRSEAGRRLARNLAAYAGRKDVVVLGLTRGGVPVAFAVAKALRAPLDVLVARKVGVPGSEELALGAVSVAGAAALNEDVAGEMDVPLSRLRDAIEGERLEVHRRESLYRRGRPPLDLTGKTALVVDDGVATGATLRAACVAARNLGAAQVVAAVPVASPDASRRLRGAADRLIAAVTMPFLAVGEAYEDFSQVSDDEVVDILLEAAPA